MAAFLDARSIKFTIDIDWRLFQVYGPHSTIVSDVFCCDFRNFLTPFRPSVLDLLLVIQDGNELSGLRRKHLSELGCDVLDNLRHDLVMLFQLRGIGLSAISTQPGRRIEHDLSVSAIDLGETVELQAPNIFHIVIGEVADHDLVLEDFPVGVRQFGLIEILISLIERVDLGVSLCLSHNFRKFIISLYKRDRRTIKSILQMPPAPGRLR